LKVEIVYIPKYSYSVNPEAGGLFPFGLVEAPSYVFSLDNFYLPECNENFVPLWMENIQAFPIFFCIECTKFWWKDYEKECLKNNIEYKQIYSKSGRIISVATVETLSQFKGIFPLFISMGASNELVMWSTNKDIFLIEERTWRGYWEGKKSEIPVVNFEKGNTLFWIGFDGHSIVGLSNNSFFSSFENICKTLPSFVSAELFEYAEEEND